MTGNEKINNYQIQIFIIIHQYLYTRDNFDSFLCIADVSPTSIRAKDFFAIYRFSRQETIKNVYEMSISEKRENFLHRFEARKP